MNLHSCQNCWFNGLQYGALGLPVGYCSRHNKLLNISDGITCGLQVRKDLSIDRAQEVADVHRNRYSPGLIVRIIDNLEHDGDTSTNVKDIESLRSDAVGEAVSDYGFLGSKIESLAQLKAMNSVRAQLAMVSLGRGYVNNCVSRSRKWTSGLHLYWWTKNRLGDIPEIKVEDIRALGGIQLARQTTLTAWSIVMLRLSFVDDITTYANAQNDPLGKATGLTDEAAGSLDTFNLRNLSRWIKSNAIPRLDSYLSESRYAQLANELHAERENAEARQGTHAGEVS